MPPGPLVTERCPFHSSHSLSPLDLAASLGLHATLASLVDAGARTSGKAPIWQRYFQQHPNAAAAHGLQPLLREHRGVAWQASLARVLPYAHAHVAARRGRRRRPGSFVVQLAGGGSRQPPLPLLDSMRAAVRDCKSVLLASASGAPLAWADGACRHPGAVLSAGAFHAALFGHQALGHAELCKVDDDTLLLRQPEAEPGATCSAHSLGAERTLFLIGLFWHAAHSSRLSVEQLTAAQGARRCSTDAASVSLSQLNATFEHLFSSFLRGIAPAPADAALVAATLDSAGQYWQRPIPDGVRSALEDLSADVPEVRVWLVLLHPAALGRGVLVLGIPAASYFSEPPLPLPDFFPGSDFPALAWRRAAAPPSRQFPQPRDVTFLCAERPPPQDSPAPRRAHADHASQKEGLHLR